MQVCVFIRKLYACACECTCRVSVGVWVGSSVGGCSVYCIFTLST